MLCSNDKKWELTTKKEKYIYGIVRYIHLDILGIATNSKSIIGNKKLIYMK